MSKKRGPRECACGCGGMTKGGRFLPGHDAKRKGSLIRAVREKGPGALAAGQELVKRGWKSQEWVVQEGLLKAAIRDDDRKPQDEQRVEPVSPKAVVEENPVDDGDAVVVVMFGKDSVLSPHAETPFSIDGVEWPSVTCYLYAMRLSDPAAREEIRKTTNIGWIKRKYAKHQQGHAAENACFDLYDELCNAVFAKVAFNTAVKKRLLETRDAPLMWDDPDPDLGARGDNLVGRVLEEARVAYRQ